MTRIYFLTALLIHYGITAYGQVVNLPVGYKLCDTAEWKLVWHDEFDSNSINTNQWYTYSDDENWFEVRPGVAEVAPYANSKLARVAQGKVIYRDENITVKNGSCILKCKYEPSTWAGPTWNESRHFTSGMLLSKNPNRNYPLYFKKGRFDLRARLPYQSGVWTSFWLYGGGIEPDPNSTPPFPGLSGSEIDMIEYNPCIGGGGMVTKMDDLPWNLHGQNRGPNLDRNYHVGGDMNVSNLGNWHIYSTEWDENFIRLYVDGILRHEQARYVVGSRTLHKNAYCTVTEGGTYYEDLANVFPRRDEDMKLILTNDITDNIYSENVFGLCTQIPEWVKSHDAIDAEWPDADFEIDYVRVYQRADKIQDGLTDLCPELRGDAAVCYAGTKTYTYELTGDYNNVRWTFEPEHVDVIDASNRYLTVLFKEGNYRTAISVSYDNNVKGCEQSSNSMEIMVGPPFKPQTDVAIYHVTGGQFLNKLSIKNSSGNIMYKWSISATANGSTVNYLEGPYVDFTSSYTPLRYSVAALNDCGSTTYSNENELGKSYGGISYNADYIFPNPVDGIATLNFSDAYYTSSKYVSIRVFNGLGKTVKQFNITNNIVQVPLTLHDMPAGVYTVEITGSEHRNYIKLLKQ